MIDKHKRFLEEARRNVKGNKKLFNRLAKKKKIDEIFHTLHDDIFSKTDCLTCANCCRTTSPIFRDVDIERIAKHLGMRVAEFTDKYLRFDEDRDWVLKSSPCSFLDLEDNTCSIYDFRPKACREYPHTDRKNMNQVMDLTFRNTMVCPAVAEMAERLRLTEG
jgi:Fe-S-cluster containining protein